MTTLNVQYNAEDDEYFIELPQELLDQVGFNVGDTVVWSKIDENSWSIQKKIDH
jgi:uncharacterized membrane protein (UPF0127 family)